jgi:hypothetical protein
MRIATNIVVAVSILSSSGCLLGDRAADRSLRLHQYMLSGATGPFIVDTSQLPANSVKFTHDEDHWGNPVDAIDVSGTVPFRVVLIPTTKP